VADDIPDEDLHQALNLLYAAESYCSLGSTEESLVTYERISLERVKRWEGQMEIDVYSASGR